MSIQITDFKDTQTLCELLLKTPHFSKIGAEGIFAIIETAKSLDIDPRIALSGGLYYTKGKVEMSARMMSALIRAKKHSISKDPTSNETICILHGKRADNGDVWTVSFSIDEAKKAGLVRPNSPWTNFPSDMLYARALSRLARQLFTDIIGNCYVEGEISLDPNVKEIPRIIVQEAKGPEVSKIKEIIEEAKEAEIISEDEWKALVDKINEIEINDVAFDESKFKKFIKCDDYSKMNTETYITAMTSLDNKLKKAKRV